MIPNGFVRLLLRKSGQKDQKSKTQNDRTKEVKMIQ